MYKNHNCILQSKHFIHKKKSEILLNIFREIGIHAQDLQKMKLISVLPILYIRNKTDCFAIKSKVNPPIMSRAIISQYFDHNKIIVVCSEAREKTELKISPNLRSKLCYCKQINAIIRIKIPNINEINYITGLC